MRDSVLFVKIFKIGERGECALWGEQVRTQFGMSSEVVELLGGYIF